MNEVLFIGGPLHGQYRSVAHLGPWLEVPVPRCNLESTSFVDMPIDPFDPSFPTVRYLADRLGTRQFGIGFYALSDMDPAEVFEKILEVVFCNRHWFTREPREKAAISAAKGRS